MVPSSEFAAGDQFGVGQKYVVTVVEIRGDEVVLAISSGPGEASHRRFAAWDDFADLSAPYERQLAS